jgi:hypothetical protein
MRTAIWLLFMALTVELRAQSNIVFNGSFETYGATLTGWYSTEGYGWTGVANNAADGQTYANISGNLYQDLSTVPGQVYQLRYAVSGNSSSDIRTLLTYWGGTLVATTPFDTTGQTNNNFVWLYVTNKLLAISSTTRLWFANADYPNAPGPNLDAVSAIPVAAPPTSCVGVPSGIISWWKGQSNAVDSASANHGTLLNGAGFTNGLIGAAFYLGGSNQCVQIPYKSSLAASNYSIETWVQPLVPIDVNTKAVLFAQNNGQCQLLASAGVSGLRVTLQFALDASTSAGVESTSEIPIGQFSHIAGTWDGSSLRLYINGVLDAQSTPGTIPFDSACPFYVGGIYNTNLGVCNNVGSFFNGVIDEVSYYSRALADSEISYIFQAGSLGKCDIVHPPSLTLQPVSKTVYAGSIVTFTANAAGDAPIGYQWQFNGTNLAGQTSNSLSLTNVQFAKAGNYSVLAANAVGSVLSSNALLTILPAPTCVTITNGLVSWWRAETNLLDGWDSNDGSSLISTNSDRGPGGNPFLVVSYGPGKVGQAFNISSNGIFIADNPSLHLTNGFSIEAWVYPTSFSGSLRTIFSKIDSTISLNRKSFSFGTSNGSLNFNATVGSFNLFTLTAPQPLQLNQWSHVAATYDGLVLRLYQNGLLVAVQTNTSGAVFVGTADVGIGAIPVLGPAPFLSSSWLNPWSGYLDEISLYNRALSDEEILSIYNADLTGKCLVAPMIAVEPRNLAVPLNEDAVFSAKVLGTKPVRYQWRFNGANIAGVSTSRLALEHVQSNNIGNYSFIVTNTLGRATSSIASLTLLPPLSCISAPTGIVAWWPANNFTNDVIGTNNASFLPTFFGGVSYATGKVAQCFNFTNRNSSAGNSAALNVGSNADFSIEGWLKVTPGGTTVFPDVLSINPFLGIAQKMSSQTVIPPFPPPTFVVGYSLLLENGRLACQVTTRSAPSNIPTFTSSGPNLVDGLFHHVAFSFHRMSATGGNLYVDGQNLLAFDTTQFGQGSLSNSASLMIGDDPNGIASSLGLGGGPPASERLDELSIYNRALTPAEVLSIYQAGSAGKCIPPPTIPVQPTNQLVQAGATATLRAVASGFPTLSYQWLKNATYVPGATSNSLIISNATITDAGQYVLTVNNVGGSVTSSVATLTVNRPPTASNLNAATIQDQPISIPIAKLLLFASDADADPLTLSSVSGSSTNGGVVVRSATDVTYTPPSGYIGSDSFTYTVSDGRGGLGSALALVQVRSANDPSGNLLPLTPIPGGFEVGFAGIPGRAYTLQRAETVTGPWSNLISVLVGPSGIGIFDDTNSPPPTAFYRTVYP